jgi:hypothetical protein
MLSEVASGLHPFMKDAQNFDRAGANAIVENVDGSLYLQLIRVRMPNVKTANMPSKFGTVPGHRRVRLFGHLAHGGGKNRDVPRASRLSPVFSACFENLCQIGPRPD